MGVEENSQKSFGGWLIAVVPGLVASPIYFLVVVIQWLPYFARGTYEAFTIPGSEYYHPFWASVLLWEFIGHTILMFFGSVLVFLFLAKSHRLPKLLLSYLVISVLYILSSNIILNSFSPTAGLDHSQSLAALVVSIAAAFVVVPYLYVSKRVRHTFTNQSIGKRPRTILLMIVLPLLAYFLIGQTAYLFIYGPPPPNPKLMASGITPVFMSVYATLLWYACFFAALWRWMLKKSAHGLGVGLGTGAAALLLAFFVGGHANEPNEANELSGSIAWVQSELNEAYMRSIDKNQCMYKTIEFLQICDSENCVRTAAGVSGDCVVWAQGTIEEFCASYDELFTDGYCDASTSNQQACRVIAAGKSVSCVED